MYLKRFPISYGCVGESDWPRAMETTSLLHNSYTLNHVIPMSCSATKVATNIF